MTRLYNHVPFAARSPWLHYRGYVKPLLDSLNVYDFLADHRRLCEECPGLGLFAWMPGGRDKDAAAWLNGLTSQRSDQMVRAAEDSRGAAIIKGVAEHTDPASTILYIGGHPADKTLGGCGLWTWMKFGYEIAFDAMSSQREPTLLSRSVVEAHARGGRFLTESNSVLRQTGDVPVIASAGDWRLGDKRPDLRTRIGQAPPGSVLWWRSEQRDGPWSHDLACRALAAGMRLCVGVANFSPAQWKDLRGLMGVTT